MRLPQALPLVLMPWLLAGCGSEALTLVGHWSCTTTHPGGFASKDLFDFSADGNMRLDSDGLKLDGTYLRRDNALTLTILNMPVPEDKWPRSTQVQILEATILKLDAKQLQMDVSTGGDHHQTQCERS